jgi:hypothetical protein
MMTLLAFRDKRRARRSSATHRLRPLLRQPGQNIDEGQEMTEIGGDARAADADAEQRGRWVLAR